MASPPADTERLVPLTGISLGDATAFVLELGRRAGYSVAATAPGTYRLARERRRGVRKHNESVVVTILEDRSGTKVRVVGALDPTIVDQLAKASVAAVQVPPKPVGDASSVSSIPEPREVPPLSSGYDQLPRPVARGASTAPPATGMIGSVPGAPRPPAVAEPTIEFVGEAAPADATLPGPARRGVPRRPTLALPDGRNLALANPIVLGRHPDPSRSPRPDATAVAIDDPALSKTHVHVAVDGDDVVAVDLHSTNGTVVEVGGTRTACIPGVPIVVPIGGVIVAGDVRIEVTT